MAILLSGCCVTVGKQKKTQKEFGVFSLNGVMYGNQDNAIQAAIAYCKKTSNCGMVFHKQGYWQPAGDMLGLAIKNNDGTVKFTYSLKELVKE